jgi:hypothetical protein
VRPDKSPGHTVHLAFVIAQPLLQQGGFAPPAYPLMTLADPAVIRVVAGSALYMAALSLIGLGVGAVMRNTSTAITFLTSLVLLPLATGWRLTGTFREVFLSVLPTAGLEVQRTVAGPDTLPIGPRGGLAVAGHGPWSRSWPPGGRSDTATSEPHRRRWAEHLST